MKYTLSISSTAVLLCLLPATLAFQPPLILQRYRTSSPLASVSTNEDDAFVSSSFFESSECDDVNTPPSLNIILRSFQQLASGSDIRGSFVDHAQVGSIANVAHEIGKAHVSSALTPLAAHCIGHAFAEMIQERSNGKEFVICIGQDPRPHGRRIADAFARGALGVLGVVDGCRVDYTGIATTPSMFEFCRAGKCNGGVMVTASHLPIDRNGLKFFTESGGFTKKDVTELLHRAMAQAEYWHDVGILPPSSGTDAVFCTEHVDFMPHYSRTLSDALIREVDKGDLPLVGLKIVLNAGHGSGGFFYQVLKDLGADVSASIYIEPMADFPAGIPNPENDQMVEVTMLACEEANADLGIMLDTDADRSGFIVPRTVSADGGCSDYEVLNRNRLIALLGVVFSKSSPGCAIVTDSVTSEGLEAFLQDKLGLEHFRYLRGYANVIAKAKELTDEGISNAEVAIETSGHCAMKENGYLDDGTYTAVKVIGMIARLQQESSGGKHKSLLDLIADMKEMPEVKELRLNVIDGSLESTSVVFDFAALELERLCEEEASRGWVLDQENLEGVRVRTGNGGFFMLRKSLHDPVVSFQVEANSAEEARKNIIQPLINIFKSDARVSNSLDLSALESY